MKLLTILGALIGFSVGVSIGVARGNEWSGIFWRATLSAVASGLLLRWWGNLWIQCLAASNRDRAEQAAKAATATPTPEPRS